jgi:hypothetical protein
MVENLLVTAVAPEPTSMGLCALIAGAMLLRRRRTPSHLS